MQNFKALKENIREYLYIKKELFRQDIQSTTIKRRLKFELLEWKMSIPPSVWGTKLKYKLKTGSSVDIVYTIKRWAPRTEYTRSYHKCTKER